MNLHFEPYSGEFARDPYPVRARMCREFLVYYLESQDARLFSRYGLEQTGRFMTTSDKAPSRTSGINALVRNLRRRQRL